jgi:hypothetical protein
LAVGALAALCACTTSPVVYVGPTGGVYVEQAGKLVPAQVVHMPLVPREPLAEKVRLVE